MATKDKLCKEEEVFCQSVLLGKSASAAFRIAFPERAQRVTEKSLGMMASALRRKEKIAARIEELKTIDSIATARGIWSKEDRLRMLEDIARNTYVPGDLASLKLCVSAVEAAARIAGDAVQKLDVNINDARINYSFNILQSLANTIEGQIVSEETKQLE